MALECGFVARLGEETINTIAAYMRKLRPAFGLLQSITCMAPYAVQRQTLPHGRQQAHRFTRASPSRKILYARLFGPERQKPCPKHAGLQVISEGI
jgi:hypothetical protein